MSSSIQRLADALAEFDSYRDALEAMRRERINFDGVLTRRAAAVSSVVSEARRLANMEARCASGSTAGDDVSHNPDIREDTVRQARDIPCDASARSPSVQVERLRETLKKIANYWGDPVPIGSDRQILIDKWMDDCHTVQNLARSELGMPLIALRKDRP